MVSSRSGGLGLVVVCLCLAACGSPAVAPTVSLHRRTRTPETASERCARTDQFVAGGEFPGWHIGALQFLSPTSGVGITALRAPCYRHLTTGDEVSLQRQRVRLALTADAGRLWRVVGAALPVGSVANGALPEQLVATAPASVWAVVGRGRLVATQDLGAHWSMQALPNPVIQLAMSAQTVWALSCPAAASRFAPLGCRPELWRTAAGSGSWVRVKLPHVSSRDLESVHLAVTPSDVMMTVAEADAYGTVELLISADAGHRWSVRPAPKWDRNSCGIEAALTAYPPRAFWLLCLGGAAAGSSTKGLIRSTDAGLRWNTVSAAPSLIRRSRPGTIPLEEPGALAAGSQTRLWLSLTNGLAQSSNGGRHWTKVPQAFDPGGWSTVIDALNTDHAWVLAPGAGLWNTTNGTDWHADGPLNVG